MSSSKHQPNRFSRYVEVHETVMRQFLRGDFVISEELAFEAGEGFILLTGQITCVGNIYIDVEKQISIVDDSQADVLVQTIAYRYNAFIRGRGNILRYDSPHPTHNQEHHVHRYDILHGDREGSVTFIENEDERPTLGEVIREVQEWYYRNYDELMSST